ncbi:MAG: hypothetical protein WC603_01455 [Candidatus Paceibacterota bacterium]|jgi:hypothetical protein
MKKIMFIIAVVLLISSTAYTQINPDFRTIQYGFMDRILDSLAINPDFAEFKITTEQKADSSIYGGYFFIRVEDLDSEFGVPTGDLICYEINISWNGNNVRHFSISRNNSYVAYYPEEKRLEISENSVEKEIIPRKYMAVLQDVSQNKFTKVW